MNDEKLYLVWLTSCAPTGSALLPLLLKYFGSARAVFEASQEDLRAAPIEWRSRHKAFCNKNLEFAEGVVEYCEKNGVGITACTDHFYPKRLFDLASPPILLYHVGEFCDLDRAPTVTVVGTRTPSAYGERAAKRLSVDLARGGAVLVSGLARGVDGLAHRAALYCETKTVGVLGCGIDRAYPPEHRELIAQVAESGLVLTEYAPGTPPNAKNFPMRNRILAALGRATLVVEASVASGSLITADQALRLGRPLYAVPSSIFSAGCAGSNHLFRCGAKCAMNADDVLEALAAEFPEQITVSPRAKPAPRKKEKVSDAVFRFPGSDRKSLLPEYKQSPPQKTRRKARERASVLELTADERALLSRLSHTPTDAEALSGGLSASVLMRLLSSLEIKGYVERVGGNRFCLLDEAELESESNFR
ncbi:MAG: DNA-processing protein DprA [Clostridia bacterium]|nr:DNA-processing protein DprA [Clostridia bacterium]